MFVIVIDITTLFRSVKIMKCDGQLCVGIILKVKESMIWRIGDESGFVI
jgi:hypothetical protein